MSATGAFKKGTPKKVSARLAERCRVFESMNTTETRPAIITSTTAKHHSTTNPKPDEDTTPNSVDLNAHSKDSSDKFTEPRPSTVHNLAESPAQTRTTVTSTTANEADKTRAKNSVELDSSALSDSMHKADVGVTPEKIPEDKIVPYCTSVITDDNSDSEDETDSGSCEQPEGTRGAFVHPTKIWQDRSGGVLRVYFMDEQVLSTWRVGTSPLNVQNIMDWASQWNNALTEKIPRFEQVYSKDQADIRVSFKSGSRCWSRVGTDATLVTNKNTATMNLDLSPGAVRNNPGFQRYLVIHEFGHVLGLEHEHQRSDFWQVANVFLDMKKMVNDGRLASIDFAKDFYELKSGVQSDNSEYDAESIMHYWFDVQWLKSKYSKYQHPDLVRESRKLTQRQKKVLLGIHRNSGQYVEKPSRTDLLFLQRIYGTASGNLSGAISAISRLQLSSVSSGPVMPTHTAKVKVADCEDCTLEQLDSLSLVTKRFDSLLGITGVDSDSLSAVLKAALKDYIDSFFGTDSPDIEHIKSHIKELQEKRLFGYEMFQWCMKEITDKAQKPGEGSQEESLFCEDMLYHASLCCLALEACTGSDCQPSTFKTHGHSFGEVSISCEDEERCLIARQGESTYYIAFEGRTNLRKWPEFRSFSEGIQAQVDKIPWQFIMDLLAHPMNRVVLTGFCFGGLVASCLATKLLDHRGWKHLKNSMVCITFAQPHLLVPGLEIIAKEMPQISKSIHSIYYEYDKIPLFLSLLDQKCSCLVREDTSEPGLHTSVNALTAFEDPLTQELMERLENVLHPAPTSPTTPQEELRNVEASLNLAKSPIETRLKRSHFCSYTHHSLRIDPETGLIFEVKPLHILPGLTSQLTQEDIGTLMEHHDKHTMRTYVDKLKRGHLDNSDYTVPPTSTTAPPPVTQVTPTLKEIQVSECSSGLSLTLLGENLWFCTQFELPGIVKQVKPSGTTSTCIKATVPDFDRSALAEFSDGEQLSVTVNSQFVQNQEFSPTLIKKGSALEMRQQHIDALKPSKLIELTCLAALLDRLPQGHFMQASKKVKIIQKFIERAIDIVPLESMATAIDSSNESVAKVSTQVLNEKKSFIPPSLVMSSLVQRAFWKENRSAFGKPVPSPTLEQKSSLGSFNVLSGAQISFLYPKIFPEAMAPSGALKNARDDLNDKVKMDHGNLTFTDGSAVAKIVTDFRQNVLPTCIALLGEYLESQKLLAPHGALPRLHDLTEKRKLEMLSKGEYQRHLSLESSLVKTARDQPHAVEIVYSSDLESLVAQLCMERNVDWDYPLDSLIRMLKAKDQEKMGNVFEGTLLSLIVESHVPVVARWLKWSLLINNLRRQVCEEFPPAIGVVGLVNSGKTKLAHSLFGIQVSSGTTEQTRTTIPFIYNLSETAGNVDIMDFPGADDIDESVRDVADLILTLAQVIIYVVDYRKVQSKESKKWLDILRSKGVPLLVCLTYADKFYAEHMTDKQEHPEKKEIERAMESELKIVKMRLKLGTPSFHMKFCTFSQDKDSIFYNEDGRKTLRSVGIKTPRDVGQWIADTFENRLDNRKLAKSLETFFKTNCKY